MKTQKIFQIKAGVVKNSRITRNYFALALDSRQIAASARPGQFLDLRVSEGYEPLLRRPLSIHRLEKNRVELLYEVVGPGTKILSQKKPGGYLDILGPLGNGFDLKPDTSDLTPILIAGGIGVAPLTFLAQKLAERIAHSVETKPLILIGARTKSQLLCEKEFKKLGFGVKIATDDGSAGFRGRVTDLLKSFLRSAPCPRRFAIYACGPKPMLKELSRIALERKIPAQVSLEAHMACGIGACLGCAIKVKGQRPKVKGIGSKVKGEFEYQRVCKEGPVFDAGEVVWEK